MSVERSAVSSDKGGWKEEVAMVAAVVALLAIWVWGVYTTCCSE